MKTFDFSLQRVLDLRVHERKQAERRLAEIQRRRRRLNDQVRQLRQGFKQSAETTRPSSADLADFRRMAAHREVTRKKQRSLLEELEKAKAQEEEIRNKVIEKRRKEETIQSLYEDERDAHIDEQMRANQKLLDEQAIARHSRQNPLRR